MCGCEHEPNSAALYLALSFHTVPFKLRIVGEDNRVQYRHTKGLTDPHWVVHLGIDPLPSTLKDGITFLDDGDGRLVPWEPDMDLEARPLECGDYPAAFEVEFVDAKRRLRQSTAEPVDAADMTVVEKALDMLHSGQRKCQLESNPFPPDRHIYLLDILAKVRCCWPVSHLCGVKCCRTALWCKAVYCSQNLVGIGCLVPEEAHFECFWPIEMISIGGGQRVVGCGVWP